MSVQNNIERMNFSSTQTRFDYPDFLEVQVKSFRDFFQLRTTPDNRNSEGLFKVF
jgi:DNA-directed RNA polymerase subunit beta